MRIEIFPSASGDCLLLTSSDGKRILADAGLPKAYTDFIASPLAKLRSQDKVIDVAYVSHIDRDHIGGILRMLGDEIKWRVYEHMQAKGRKFKEPSVPRPPEIKEIWHNAFLEDIASTNAVNLSSALMASADTLSGLNAADFGNENTLALAAKTEMLALSVGDALELNWRIGDNQLGIPLNPDFDGEFMTFRPDEPINVGAFKVSVLGPTAKHLEELREFWNDWLGSKLSYVERLRKRHAKDVDNLESGALNDELAELTQSFSESVEKDVTPPNLASLVLLVEDGNKRILLTGDAGDESILEYLREADLLDGDGNFFVDALKVPHHGAHNSYSETFVKKVRAANYIFCGDGEHHNPEPEVVAGYLQAAGANPLANGQETSFWFNWSSTRVGDHKPLWKEIERMFLKRKRPPSTRRKSLRKRQKRLKFDLV